MKQVQLVGEPRTSGGKAPARKLRREGFVPAVVYGLDGGAQDVSVPARALQHILSAAGGSNTLIELVVGGSSQLTLPRDVQRHPVRGTLLHVDFVRVKADQAIESQVPIQLVGEAPGVREGGRLEQLVFHVNISAPASAIPPAIEVDVSELQIEGKITLGEVRPPAGVTLTGDPDLLVAHVPVPRGAPRPGQ